MNIGIDGLVEEIIFITLEDAGISGEIIDKVIDAIKYSCKETNFMHNSVSDTNFYGAQKREDKRKEDFKEKEHQKEVKNIQKEFSEEKDWYKRRIRFLEERVEELNREASKNR